MQSLQETFDQTQRDLQSKNAEGKSPTTPSLVSLSTTASWLRVGDLSEQKVDNFCGGFRYHCVILAHYLQHKREICWHWGSQDHARTTHPPRVQRKVLLSLGLLGHAREQRPEHLRGKGARRGLLQGLARQEHLKQKLGTRLDLITSFDKQMSY